MLMFGEGFKSKEVITGAAPNTDRVQGLEVLQEEVSILRQSGSVTSRYEVNVSNVHHF